MELLLSLDEILILVNILLGILVGLLGIRFIKEYEIFRQWWRSLILLGLIIVLGEVVVLTEQGSFAILMKTIMLGYLFYFLSYIPKIFKELNIKKSD